MTLAVGQLPVKGVQDATQLTNQIAVTTTGNDNAVNLPRPAGGLGLELDLTSAGTAAGDTLDVYVQAQEDGSNWLDVCHFTQILGNGGAKRYFAKLVTNQPLTMFENAAALAAGSTRNLFGDVWRVRWVIASASNPIFTFKVWAAPT